MTHQYGIKVKINMACNIVFFKIISTKSYMYFHKDTLSNLLPSSFFWILIENDYNYKTITLKHYLYNNFLSESKNFTY